MEGFFTYLAKSALWIALFWGVYRLFLANETFYRFNRWYLVAGVALSFVLPAVQLHYVREVARVSVAQVPASGVADAVAHGRTVGWQAMAGIGYLAVVVVLTVRAAARFLAMRRYIRTRGYTQHDGYRLVAMGSGGSPFSFGRYIFLDPARVSAVEREVIVAHELAHIRGRHRFDLLLAGALCTVEWINPFARPVMRSIRQNHEYLADREVLAAGRSRAVYKAVLINNSLGRPLFELGHTLATDNNLKRYKMMDRKISSGKRKLPVLIMLPVAAAVLAAFAQPRYVTVAQGPKNKTVTHLIERLDAGKEGDPLPLFIVDGYVVSEEKFRSIDEKDVRSVTVLKDVAALGLDGEKARNGVIVVETGKPALPAVTRSRTTPKPVVATPQPVMATPESADPEHPHFDIQMRSGRMIADGRVMDGGGYIVMEGDMQPEAERPLCLVDGREVGERQLRRLAARSKKGMERDNGKGVYYIETLEKGTAEAAAYGERGAKNGVVKIATRKPQRVAAMPELVFTGNFEVAEADRTVIHDNAPFGGSVEYMRQALRDTVIKSLTVKKDRDAVVVKIGDNADHAGLPLFIVDGYETSIQKFEALDPVDTERVVVIKDNAATKMYGERGRNGVVMVETRKGGGASVHRGTVSYETDSEPVEVTGVYDREKNGPVSPRR